MNKKILSIPNNSRFDSLDLLNKSFAYKWIYSLSANQWNKLLDATKIVLQNIVDDKEDPRLVISIRNDNNKRLAVIFGQKYVGGFYLSKEKPIIRFYIDADFNIKEDSRFSESDWEFADKKGKLIYCDLEAWKGQDDPLINRIRKNLNELYINSGNSGFKRNHLSFMYNVILDDKTRKQFIDFVQLSPQQRLLEAYRQYLGLTQNYDELYKWEIGKRFEDNWNLKAVDFGNMLSSIKFDNLLSQQSTSFYNLARKNPEDARKYFEFVFDNSITVEKRIKQANDKGKELIKKWHPTWTDAGQDERTLSVFWAFNDLTTHAPYKSSFYKKYCDFIGVKPEKPGAKYQDYLRLINEFIRDYIDKDEALIKLHDSFLNNSKHISDPKHKLMAQNILYRILDINWNPDSDNDDEDLEEDNLNNIAKKRTFMDGNLNTILFGPPGTGKTFNSINEALKIVDPIYFEANEHDREKLTERFKELLIKNWDETKGQIAFCTFHQSFSYEDFIEGIKPKTSENKNVYYDIEAGVFKRICQLADSNNSTVKVIKEGKFTWDEEQFNSASFFKLSLGQANSVNDRPIYEYCRDNNYIAIGFGEENDFSSMSENQIVEKCKELGLEATSSQQLNYFIHNLKINNYVIIGNGNKYVRAIGKVIGDYEYVADSPIQYNHFRKVEWLFVDANIPIEELYEKGLSQKTLYKIDETALKKDFFTNKGQQEVIDVKEDKKYVLIIDEINRGNVSSIFGELITLIEKDKRAGCNEELEVTLPYSKESFKVPKNVYLIGTMNTADRSIEALDTALRRRFSFKEFAPKPELIKTEGLSGALNGIVNGIDLALLLDTINTRIEKLIDKDHKIGHSYLLKVNSEETLKSSFRNEIIPLLEEYFFGDYGKIGLVLGSTFVEKVNHDFNFAAFDEYDTDIQSDLKEKKVFRIAAETNWDFSKI
jgi:hypothetical protein